MKNEKFYEAMENINDELILGAAEEPKRKTHPISKIKWTVLAAAIALLVAVPVVAKSFGLTLVNNEEYGYWDAYNEDARYALDEFSPELLERAEEIDNPEGMDYILFGSIRDLEDFLGLELPRNKALKAQHLSTAHMKNHAGEEMQGRYRVMLGKGQTEDLIRVDVGTSYFEPDGIDILVNYDFITEKMPFENAGAMWTVESEGHKTTDPEIYITQNGRECAVAEMEYTRFTEEAGEYGYIGVVMAERVVVRIQMRGFDKAKVYDRLIEILENFE